MILSPETPVLNSAVSLVTRIHWYLLGFSVDFQLCSLVVHESVMCCREEKNFDFLLLLM